VLQAFIDESIDQGEVFVLGGYIATAEAWANFSREWEKLVSSGWGTTRPDGNRHFKMSEMAMEESRMERVEVFFRVIEDHVIGHLSARVDVRDIAVATSRILLDGNPLPWPAMYTNPYHVAFRVLMDGLHLQRENMAWAIPLSDKIDFYFDNRTEKKAILEEWDRYVENRPDEAKKYYGATPQFKDDLEFLPLQAADFWAWWIRKWHKEDPKLIRAPHFGRFGFKNPKLMLSATFHATEDDIAGTLLSALRIANKGRGTIYDVKIV
jgi:hypothetical protein